MGFFTRFRRGMRKSITSISSSHSATAVSASPPSSPPPPTAATAMPEPASAPAPTPAAVAPASSSLEAHKPPSKILSWRNSDKPTTSTSATNATGTKWSPLRKKKTSATFDDSKTRSRREHQEMLERFTITFGTRRRSQLVPDDDDGDGTWGRGYSIGGVSPRTSRRGSVDDDYVRRAADIEQHQ